MAGRNISCDVDGRHQGICCGGIGSIQQLAIKTGLVREINERIRLPKRHLPYHEPDHILQACWQALEKTHRHEVRSTERQKPEKIKQQVVKGRKFRKIVTTSEAVAECEYRPGKCGKTCRLIILRKNQDVVRGQQLPFKNVRYFFCTTNGRKRTSTEMLLFYRGRSQCH